MFQNYQDFARHFIMFLIRELQGRQLDEIEREITLDWLWGDVGLLFFTAIGLDRDVCMCRLQDIDFKVNLNTVKENFNQNFQTHRRKSIRGARIK